MMINNIVRTARSAGSHGWRPVRLGCRCRAQGYRAQSAGRNEFEHLAPPLIYDDARALLPPRVRWHAKLRRQSSGKIRPVAPR